MHKVNGKSSGKMSSKEILIDNQIGLFCLDLNAVKAIKYFLATQ